MQARPIPQKAPMTRKIETVEMQPSALPELVRQSFQAIAPFWPLKNLIAVNPLQGLEDLPVEEALRQGQVYFEQIELPAGMDAINRETLKWMQVFTDEGQATLSMPLRAEGLYAAWRQLALHDVRLHGRSKNKQRWLRQLPQQAEQAIEQCLNALRIAGNERALFLRLMLTTLPGWAAHVKYRTEWAGLDREHSHPLTQEDYLAMRLALTCLLWPEARQLLAWHTQATAYTGQHPDYMPAIEKAEQAYRPALLRALAGQPLPAARMPSAQLVFCIDVRSEPFRRALEATGEYETFGFAGFFGVPVQIEDAVTGETYASCPVLLQPQHRVVESPCCGEDEQAHLHVGQQRLWGVKRLYQSVKYSMTTPFALVETLGAASGVWMAMRCFAPDMAERLKQTAVQAIRPTHEPQPSLAHMTLAEQCTYAEGALRMMGLTQRFAPLVIMCGHGSTTRNNAFATALDCGACGGRHGASNARILAMILNRAEVRAYLAQQGIQVPDATCFMAAEHDTTTDAVQIYTETLSLSERQTMRLLELKADLEEARERNNAVRLATMRYIRASASVRKAIERRACNWAEARPEWGLARNAAFLVAPRSLSERVDLQGRVFLHSYDPAQDTSGTALTTILTAPMVVAEWINTQYLCSTLQPVTYGAGSKVTKNVTGKIGVMQGNASDLMTGLPLQSVYADDDTPYHEPQRLMTVVYAPRKRLDSIIQAQAVLQKLFGNGWVQLVCIEPESHEVWYLQRDFGWQRMQA